MHIGHAEIEQRERVLRPLGQLKKEDSQVTFEFPCLCRRALVRPRMNDIQLGPAEFAAQAPDRRQDLLVDSPVKPQLRTVAEQLDVIDRRDVRLAIAFFAATRAVHL